MDNFNYLEHPERFRSNAAPFSNSLQEYYTDIFRSRHRERQIRLDAVQNAQQAVDYVKNIRAAIKSKFNFPAEKTPLDAQTIYRKDRKDHIVEGVTFFSRPGVAVSALFMLPKTPGPHPAVLFLCGHSLHGKFGYYQPIVSDLARQGFAVLALDPMGQGERNEGITPTHEHNLFGRRLGVAGEQFAAWRVYDAMRGIDYLAGRSEVDCSILGVTGCSGGCTLMSMVMAVDDRPTMAAGSCAITSFLRNVENELPCDIEQLPQTLGSVNMEMADFLIAAAPRPMLLLGQENDFFDPRGTAEAAAELKKIYTLLGRGDDTDYREDTLWHNFSLMHRHEMMKFFCSYAGLEPIAFEKLDQTEVDKTEYFCSPDGKITNLPGTLCQHALTVEYGIKAAAEQKKYSENELRRELKNLLAVKDITLPAYRVLRPVSFKIDPPVSLGRFGIETENGRVMCLLKQCSIPGRACYRLAENCAVDLYIGHLDSQKELERKIIACSGKLCMLDVRGIGEMTPAGCDRPEKQDFFNPYQFDYHFAALGDFLQQSILGRRITDVLSAVELLQRCNCQVTLHGRGQGAITALLAAFIKKLPVTLEDCPTSYSEYLKSDDQSLPQSMLPFGMLKLCDLDEIMRFTQAKLLT